jgi:hypothetical protein
MGDADAAAASPVPIETAVVLAVIKTKPSAAQVGRS